MAPGLRDSVTVAARPSSAGAAYPSSQHGDAAHLRAVSRDFGTHRVLDNMDLDIAAGEFVALIGRSGSGKSTLLRALAGLDPDVTGEVIVNGQVAIAFQEPRLLPWKPVADNVSLGLHGSDDAEVARNALAEVGLAARADAWPLTLSGGEAQRVSLARALVRSPGLLLLDEPFSALDALTRITIHRLVLDLWQRHRPAVLLVTHDVDEALELADRVLVLADGRIAHEVRIAADRPRDRTDQSLTTLRDRLLTELGVTPEGIA
jgi:sulfonate transport system ATP-binding protein